MKHVPMFAKAVAALEFVTLAFFTPIPSRAQMPRRTSRSSGRSATPATDVLAAAVASFTGKLRVVDKREIVIESAEEQLVSFHRSKKTRFLAGDKPVKADAIPLEAIVTVEASKDSVGDLVAVDIIWKKS